MVDVLRAHGCLFVFLFVLHGILVVFVYFYVQTEANPLPRGVINRTKHGLQAFSAFAYIFGGVLGLCDSALFASTVRQTCFPKRRSGCVQCLAYIPLVLMSISIALFFILSPMIFSDIATGPAFAHACDNDWMTVLLTGHSYDHTSDPSTADFSLSSSPTDILFTFASQDLNGFTFNLTSTNPFASTTPSLRSVQYDFTSHNVSGLCLGNSDSGPCMTGSFDDTSYLTFDVSLNGTRSLVRSLYKEWSLEDVPSVMLYRVDQMTNTLTERVLQTSIAGTCQTLKVCVTRPTNFAMTTTLDFDVVVAVGWVLYRQAAYAVDCSTPSKSSI